MFSQSFGLMTDDTGSLSRAFEGCINVKYIFPAAPSTWRRPSPCCHDCTVPGAILWLKDYATPAVCLRQCLLDIIKRQRCLATPVKLNPTSWKTMASDSWMETCISFSRRCELANASQLLNSSYFPHLIINCLHVSTFAHLPEKKKSWRDDNQMSFLSLLTQSSIKRGGFHCVPMPSQNSQPYRWGWNETSPGVSVFTCFYSHHEPPVLIFYPFLLLPGIYCG